MPASTNSPFRFFFRHSENASSILLIIAAVGVVLALGNRKSVCQRTLQYSVETVDPRFHITTEEVRQAAQKAVSVWNEAAGRPIFAQSPDGRLKIRLLFDERQRQALEKKQIASDLHREEGNYNSLADQRHQLSEMYEQRLEAYNADIARLNGRRQVSKEEFDNLEGERVMLNALADQINGFAKHANETVKALKETTELYNRGAGKIFDRGEFNGSAINIYQFDNPLDLSMVLAHEFGHALLLGHVANSKSLMYYLSRDQPQESITLTAEDRKALEEECSNRYVFDPRALRIAFHQE